MKRIFALIVLTALVFGTFSTNAAAYSNIAISNPGFSSIFGYIWGDWMKGGTTSAISAVTSDGANGTKDSVKFLSDSSSCYMHQNVTVKGGDRLTLSFWVKVVSLTETGQAFATIGFSNDDGFSYQNGYIFHDITGKGWQKQTLEILVPESATQMAILLRMNSGGEVYYDEVSLTNETDATSFRVLSGGLELDRIVEGAGALNISAHYVSDSSAATNLVAAVYENGESNAPLSEAKMTSVSGNISQNVDFTFDKSVFNKDSAVKIFNWDSNLTPLSIPLEFPKKVQRSNVFDYFVVNRMRGAYGGLNEFYMEDTRSLCSERGINTLIFNIIGTFYDEDVTKNDEAFEKVLDDIDAYIDETGIKIFMKMSFGSNAPTANAAYGTFHPGKTHSLNLPCPRKEEYWNAQITDILSQVAQHPKITGAVIDFEMYSGGATSYGGPCLCDDCVADFLQVTSSDAGKALGEQEITTRLAYLKTNCIYNEYYDWHKASITEISANVRKALHAVNPNLIIGCMPTFDWLPGTCAGLGTQEMPVLVFSENEYRGNLSNIYGNAALLKKGNLPAVYTTGLWTNKDEAIASDVFTDKAVEAGLNSMGYWMYALHEMRNNGEQEAYFDAIEAANTKLDSELAK